MGSLEFFFAAKNTRVRLSPWLSPAAVPTVIGRLLLAVAFLTVAVTAQKTTAQTAESRGPDGEVAAPASAERQAPPQPGNQAPPQPENIVGFDILEFAVSGNSLLEAADIQRTLSPYLGFDRTIADIDAARAALEDLYKEKGYVTVVVDVPEQSVADAVLTMQVTEGRVDRLLVTGADYNRPSLIKEAVPSLGEGQVPNLNQVRSELSAVNAVAGRDVTPMFRAGMAPGTVDVDLIVNDEKPWGASLEANDQFNGSTSRSRLIGSVRYDNLFQANHSANFLYQISPQEPDEIQVFSGSYFFPVTGPDFGMVVYGLDSNTDVATVDGITVIGEGFTLGTRGVISLDNSGDFIQSFIVGFDYKDFEDSVTIDDADTGFALPVSYLPFTLQYQSVLAAGSATTQFNLGTTFAFDRVVSDDEEFAQIRNAGEASFIYLYGGVSHNRMLSDSGLLLTAEFDFQLAPAALISNEQFSIGGLQSVRGYRQAEALGDSGVRASIQLTYPLPAGDSIGHILDNWKAFVFADGGYVTSNAQLPGDAKDISLGSVGLGTTFDMFDGAMSGRADIAYQLDTDPTNAGEDVDSDFGDFRVHFSIITRY